MTMPRIPRIVAEVIGFALTMLLTFAVALLLERILLPGAAWYSRAILYWPLALPYLAGRLSNAGRTQHPWLVLLAEGVSVLLALALIFLQLPERSSLAYLFWALSVFPGVAMFVVGRICVPVYPQWIAIGTVVLYLADIVIFYVAFSYRDTVSPLTICALVSFFLYLFSANSKGLWDGAHAQQGQGSLPTGLRGRNALLLTGFSAVCVVLVLTGVLQTVLGFVLGTLWRGLVWLWNWFWSLFPEDSGGPVPQSPPTQEPMEMPDVPESDLIRMLIILFVSLIVLAALIALVVNLMRLGFHFKGRLRRPRWLRRHQETNTDETDVEEDLFDWNRFWGRGRDYLRGLGDRLRRPKRFSDMPDDESRVRFAYRALLRSPAAGENTRCATPRELGARTGSGEVAAFTAGYGRFRYGGEAATPELGEEARQTVRFLQKSAKTKKK